MSTGLSTHLWECINDLSAQNYNPNVSNLLILLQQVIQLWLFIRKRWGIGVRRNNFHRHSLTTLKTFKPNFCKLILQVETLHHPWPPIRPSPCCLERQISTKSSIGAIGAMLDSVARVNPPICSSSVETTSGSIKRQAMLTYCALGCLYWYVLTLVGTGCQPIG